MSQIITASPTLPRAFYRSLLATVLFAMGMTVLIPIIPLFITDELGAAENWVGTATLSIATASVILRIPAGAFSDRQGRQIMLIGALIGVVASVLYVLAHSLAFLLARDDRRGPGGLHDCRKALAVVSLRAPPGSDWPVQRGIFARQCGQSNAGRRPEKRRGLPGRLCAERAADGGRAGRDVHPARRAARTQHVSQRSR
jgi:hypothetical protein